MNEKIGSIESIALILIITLNHIILSIPKVVISTTGSASLLNILYITAIALIFMRIINKYLSKFPGFNIFKISEFLGGKTLKYIIGGIFIIYFFTIIGISMRSICENLKMIYFQNYSIIFLIGLFTLSIIGCSFLGIKSIIRANLIILPLLIISIVFIFLANIKNFDFNLIFPILGNGFYSTFFSGLSNLYAFSSIVVLYFIPSLLENYGELKKISYISIIMSSILLLFSVGSVLFIFPVVENLEQILPLYLVIRFIEFGRFFQRIDAAFLLVWVISAISYLSIVFAATILIFKELFNIKNLNSISPIIGLLIFGISLIPKNLVQIRFLQSISYRFFVIFIIFILNFIILFLANLKLKRQNEKRVEIYEETF